MAKTTKGNTNVFFQSTPCLAAHVHALHSDADGYVKALHFLLESGTFAVVSTGNRARMIAALHIASKHKMLTAILGQCEAIDVVKALTLLDRARKLRQLRERIQQIQSENPHLKLHKTTEGEGDKKTEPKRKRHRRKIDVYHKQMTIIESELEQDLVQCNNEDCETAHSNTAVGELVQSASVSGALGRKVRHWAKTHLKDDFLEFVMLAMPSAPWQTLADLVHFSPSDFGVSYFLTEMHKKEDKKATENDDGDLEMEKEADGGDGGPKEKNFVTAMRALVKQTDEQELKNQFNRLTQEFPQVFLVYSFIRTQKTLTANPAIMEELAKRVPLDTAVWYFEEFLHASKRCENIIFERLTACSKNEGGDNDDRNSILTSKATTYGKLMERVLTIQRMQGSGQYEEGGESPKPEEVTDLDLVFLVDNTGSMGSWIQSAQENVQRIIRDIVAAESANVRFALVSYRDHPPQDSTFVTKTHDFTDNVPDMQKWVDEMKADGGGDTPEAVADGLYDTLNLSYRPRSTKVAVLVADAPPHGLGCYSDGFPSGCPHGHDPMKIVRQMSEKGIAIYSVICGNFEGQAFYQGISQMTGGQYIPLSSAHLLAGVIVGGAQEEISLERLMQQAQEVVEAEEMAAGRELDEDELATKLQSVFRARGVSTLQTRFGGSELPEFEPSANCYATVRALAEVRETKGRKHLAMGHYGTGIDSASAGSAFAAERSDVASLSQCKRLVKKLKARLPKVSNSSFAQEIIPFATTRLEILRAFWRKKGVDGKVAVFGDASYSMQSAIEAATIFASMVSVCFDGELSFFQEELLPSPHKKPRNVHDVLDICRKVKPAGCTSLASALRPYLKNKEWIDTFILVTDEEENANWEGRSFAEMFANYKRAVNNDVTLVVVCVGRGDRGFRETLHNHGIKYKVVYIDGNRPDLAKFDALLGQLAFLSSRARLDEDVATNDVGEEDAEMNEGSAGKKGDGFVLV